MADCDILLFDIYRSTVHCTSPCRSQVVHANTACKVANNQNGRCSSAAASEGLARYSFLSPYRWGSCPNLQSHSHYWSDSPHHIGDQQRHDFQVGFIVCFVESICNFFVIPPTIPPTGRHVRINIIRAIGNLQSVEKIGRAPLVVRPCVKRQWAKRSKADGLSREKPPW